MDAVDKWFSDRWSKFTASQNYKLLVGVPVGKVFGSGGLTYIEEKAMEMTTVFWERPELEEVKSLLHGKVHEYPAFEAYVKETKNTGMVYMGTENPVFLEHEELKGESGGTPDMGIITSAGAIELGGEIKCPRQPIEHFRRLVWKSQWDIKENYLLCYTQMQHLMMITKAPLWHFISYDERQISKKNKIKIIEVKPDVNFQNNLEIKLRLAITEKYKVLSKHLGMEVKDRNHLLQLQAA